MSYIVGIALSFTCIRLSLYFLDQSFSLYFDDVALSMVVGGTCAVGIIALPWNHFSEFRRCVARLIFSTLPGKRRILRTSLDFVRARSQGTRIRIPRRHMAYEILNDGDELLDLNFTPDDIATILNERLHQYVENRQTIADFFANLAKYPPAFGLAGTVFGLINLMRAITEGLDPSQTGVKMALALVATLYGLIVSNFIVAPIGEHIAKNIAAEKEQAEIAVQAVILVAEGETLLKSQEMLNSFVNKKDRIDLIGNVVDESMAA